MYNILLYFILTTETRYITFYIDDLNNIHHIIFKMEVEYNKRLPFLHIVVYKNTEGNLGHKLSDKQQIQIDIYVL